jgi:hypothetical protein
LTEFIELIKITSAKFTPRCICFRMELLTDLTMKRIVD